MSRYFSRIDGVAEFPRNGGIVLHGAECARAEAVTAAGEMLRDSDGRFWDGPEWQMRAIDEIGVTVCTLTIKGTANES